MKKLFCLGLLLSISAAAHANPTCANKNFGDLDRNVDGKISFQEFSGPQTTEERTSLRQLDRERKFAEKHTLTSYDHRERRDQHDEKFNVTKIKEKFDGYDADNSGEITKEEFETKNQSCS